jgi:hypothetical protein
MARSWLGVGLKPAGTWGNVAVMGWLGWQRLGCARRCCLAAVELCWCFLISVGSECLLAPAREAFMVACLRIATQLDACVFPVVILARLVVKLSSSVSGTGCLAAAACVFWRVPGCHATAGWCLCGWTVSTALVWPWSLGLMVVHAHGCRVRAPSSFTAAWFRCRKPGRSSSVVPLFRVDGCSGDMSVGMNGCVLPPWCGRLRSVPCQPALPGERPWVAVFSRFPHGGYLVDPASSHMLVSKIKPCMSKYKLLYTVKLRMAH